MRDVRAKCFAEGQESPEGSILDLGKSMLSPKPSGSLGLDR